MMNPYMSAGRGQNHAPPAVPLHPSRARHGDYHIYSHPLQQPTMPPFPYAHYHPSPAYYIPAPQYPPQRWHMQYPPQAFVPPPPPPQQVQGSYQPRSPIVISSHPHATPASVTRQTSSNPPQQPPQPVRSPQPIPHHPERSSVASAAPTPPAAPDQEVIVNPSPLVEQRVPAAANPLSLLPEHKDPYWPTLPWYSTPEGSSTFPPRLPSRRRRRRNLPVSAEAVALPTRDGDKEESHISPAEELHSEASTVAGPSEGETPATSQAPSESDITQASTPATPAPIAASSPPKPTPAKPIPSAKRDARRSVAIPHIPGLSRPKDPLPRANGAKEAATAKESTTRDPPSTREEATTPATIGSPVKAEGASVPTNPAEKTTYLSVDESAVQVEASPGSSTVGKDVTAQTSDKSTIKAEESTTLAAPEESSTVETSAPPSFAPKSWADLLRPSSSSVKTDGLNIINGFQLPSNASIVDVLKQYHEQSDKTVSFLEPRGLVNTGNMCYMNSILQVLVFCTPFYNFLDQVRQRTVQSMKSDTPLLDAMIMFMKEFKVLDYAQSVELLRTLLKPDQLEVYGDSVTPEYVYDVIRKLPRFAGMRRGHQQDAEEFLGFLLEGLHDECVRLMQDHPSQQPLESDDASSTSGDGWLEVGRKQKLSVTRTSGREDTPSPITKIFGGHFRSELRVPGLSPSVTLEPYKPLPLDIGAPHVNNIVDALKGLTRTEALSGDFGGRGNTAKKQVFIEDLPPVLILHLKRFQYDNSSTGTQKIWKKVGYPLVLEIPKEVFPPGQRAGLAVRGGLPKYRLISVVYHHGKSAAGGHYTVDVLRQDSREWVRIDDTFIRRIRNDDVAEGGSEEDPKLLARALEQHKAELDLQKQRNMYVGLDDDEQDTGEHKPWSEVNGHPNGHSKKWSVSAGGVTTGASSPSSTTGKHTPTPRKENFRDNKVAYILLYERLRD